MDLRRWFRPWRSDLDQATLDGLRIMDDRLCSEYPYMPADQLVPEGRIWLRRITMLQGSARHPQIAPKNPGPRPDGDPAGY
jgi:hypothetical protein